MRQQLAAVAGLLFLGGCASLGEQIQHQQEIIQRCDLIKDSPQLPNWQIGKRYLLERAGAFANCTLHSDLLKKGSEANWKALCELDEILLRHDILHDPKASNALQKPIKDLQDEWYGSPEKLHTGLESKLIATQLCIDKIFDTTQNSRTILPKAIKCIDENAYELIQSTGKTYRALAQVELKAKETGSSAEADLQRWALTSQSTLQKLLSAETLKDDFIVNLAQNHAMTFLAERSYRQLKKTVAGADKRIDRLDEKAYGALTVGNWAFSPKLQDAVVASIPPQLVSADTRDGNSKASSIFYHELARAACINVASADNGEVGMLQALIDGAFIKQATHNFNQTNLPINMAQRAHSQERSGFTPYAAKQSTAQSMLPPPVNTIDLKATCNCYSDTHKVYSAYEWQARRQLIENQINERNRNVPRSGNNKQEAEQIPPPFPSEAEVRKLAKDAASRNISPGYLKQLAQNGLDKSESFWIPAEYWQVSQASIRQDIQVAWAEQTMVINSQISNDNRNANTIIVNSPVALPAPAKPDLCPAIRTLGLMCTPRGDGWQITPPPGLRFPTFNATDNTLELLFQQTGSLIAAYSAQHNKTLHAQVDGYTSTLSADQLCADKGNALKSSAYTLLYSQKSQISGLKYQHRNPLPIPITASIDCRDKASHPGNLLLSAARAMWAAHVLEQSAQGAIVIDGIQAHGKQLANGNITNHPADRTVAITLEAR